MNDRPLPTSLARFSGLANLKYRGTNEWSAACPRCGGEDRFRLWDQDQTGNARAWCRRCQHFEWADQDQPQELDPVRIKEAEELRREYARREELRLQEKIAKLRESAYWQGYHDAMRDYERGLWRAEGIADSLQDYFKLGFVAQRTFNDGDNQFVRSAMTIPIFDKDWEAVNVQYRIMEPPPGVGKYRFTAGLPAPLYLTDPETALDGPTLVVEGAKKAIITYAHMGHKIAVVAVPSKSPGTALVERLAQCDPVYIGLDPDAYTDGRSAKRFGDALGERARFVRFPAKPDDMIHKYGLRTDDMMRYIDQATREIG